MSVGVLSVPRTTVRGTTASGTEGSQGRNDFVTFVKCQWTSLKINPMDVRNAALTSVKFVFLVA